LQVDAKAKLSLAFDTSEIFSFSFAILPLLTLSSFVENR